MICLRLITGSAVGGPTGAEEAAGHCTSWMCRLDTEQFTQHFTSQVIFGMEREQRLGPK